MPRFRYTARDAQGLRIEETIPFSSEPALRAHLRERRLYVLQIREELRGARGIDLRRRVPLADLVVAVRQFRTMLRAGMPLVTGLDTLAEQSPNPRLREAFARVSRAVMQGGSLQRALGDQSEVFPPLLITFVAAGEKGGRLPEALGEAGRQLELEMEIRQKLVTAAVYPAFVLGATFVTMLVMVLYVTPAFAQIYRELQAPLPVITLSLIRVHEWLVRFGWLGLLLLALLLPALRGAAGTEEGRLRLDRLKLRIPLLGDLVWKSAAASFSGTLAGLLESGVPLLNAMETAAGVCGNAVVAGAIRAAAENVSHGRRLSDALAETGQLPPLVVRLVAVAEGVGTLPGTLREVAAAYVEEVEYALRRIVVLVEPATVLAVGGVVGYVLLALYYPLFNLGNLFMKGS